ncbi:uncharacterized protein LOC132277333 [Cornus florida]|uniref:uncharacterized protein LOC132277333 n=1 Tax=Cornus florida TaxID=4283 RepID=UPI0028971117|nr:uncharacterized protein LOC132277333 [Cornus florida]
MWHGGKESFFLPGQTNYPKRFQEAHMENKILPPPPGGNHDIDFLGGLSKKRKFTVMDQPGAIPCIPWESNVQQSSFVSRVTAQRNTHGPCLNQENSVEPFTFRRKYEKDQFRYQNNIADTWQTSYGNTNRSEIDKISSPSLSMPPPFLHYKGSFPSVNMSLGETFTASNRQPQAVNMLDWNEAYKYSPFLKSNNGHTEKAQIDPGSQDSMSFGVKNHVVTNKVPLEMCNNVSECLRPMEILQQNFLAPNRFSDDLNGSTCAQESRTVSLGALVCTEQNENHSLLQNEVQLGNVALGNHLSDASENKGGHEGGNIKTEDKTEVLDVDNFKSLLKEDFSPNGHNPANVVEHGQKNDLSHISPKLDEKSNLHSGKAACTLAEKLWDGSLQLNSSVIVSAVAFFKSGEKLLDVNWSEFLEVKGKVRLEAFEKYIQDLPRSRNRGLMVISLCWKEGTSETGLKGMKEIARGYKKGERVGFAQLSPGVDLYICPRSDTIITILAKYGFFKGMAAVEDNQDSLIGCVVWRRNRSSSNSVASKSEIKKTSLPEQPSPSDSAAQQVLERKRSPTQTAQESIPNELVPASSTLDSPREKDTESKNGGYNEVQFELAKSFSSANSLMIPSVPSDSSSILVGHQRSLCSNSTTFEVPQGQLLQVGAPAAHCSGHEQPRASLELQKPVVSLPADVLQQPTPTSDDDDLPEFDFGAACGISQTKMGKPLDALAFDSKHPTEGMDGSMPPKMTIMQTMSTSNQRSDHSTVQRLPLAASQEIPVRKNIGEPESWTPLLPNLDEKQRIQIKTTTASVSGTYAPPKNLFDDDDDMPEWCPSESHKPTLAENSTLKNLPPGLPRPVLPSLFQAASRPLFHSRVFPPASHCPITVTVKAPQPRPFLRGPISSTTFNSNSVSRSHPSPFDVKLPFHPADKRGWRP